MASNPSYRTKSEWLPQLFHKSGASFLSSKLPARDSLLVLNYHRIGNPDDDLFDPGVFSATADEFDEQISYLKKNVSMITLDEALNFVNGSQKDKGRCRVLITFDDGYMDNYEIAHPILRSHGVQGVFFLVTSMIGSHHVPWWDRIAYLMKTGRRHKFSLHYPGELKVDIERDGLRSSLRSVLRLYKNPENTDPARFMGELAVETRGEEPPAATRRFLNWDEAREMSRTGAAIGSHTHSHTVLSQLDADRQFEELSKSRKILTEQLGVSIDSIAYPVGKRNSFTDETQRIAKEAGYRAAFSFYGGANFMGKTSPFNVCRFDTGDFSLSRLRLETAVWKLTGRVRWP